MAKRGLKSASPTSFGQIRGNPRNTTKPGPGVAPEVYRRKMQLLASRHETIRQLEAVLEQPNHPAFMRAVEFAADRGYGKAPSSVDVTSNGQTVNGLLVIPPET